MPGTEGYYLQVSSVLCLMNCSLSPDTLTPDCSSSAANCCSPDPLSCFSFYTCDASTSTAHLTFCGPLQSYNAETLRCEHQEEQCLPKCAKRCHTDDDGNAICGPNDESCCLPNADNCKYFTTCSNSIQGIGQCPAGSVFDEQQLACVPGDDCFQSSQKCTKLCPRGELLCKYDCCGPPVGYCIEQYYRCVNGVRISSTCPKNTVFNQTSIACDANTYTACTSEQIVNNFTKCTPIPKNPAVSPIIINPTVVENSSAMVERRRFLTENEFLSLMYSAYRNFTDLLTVPFK